MEKFIINGKQVQPEEIRVIWTDAFGNDHDGDILGLETIGNRRFLVY